jgi:hypothetical protein
MRRPAFLPLLLLLVAVLPNALSAQVQISAGAASITVGGRLHLQYSRSSVDGEGGGPDAIDDLFVRRARIQLNLRMSDAFDARVEPDFGGGGVGVGLADAWARVTLGPGLRLSAGQFKRAFSTFELTSSTDLPLIERDGRIEGMAGCPGVASVCTFSRFSEALAFDDRDIGLRAEGALGSKVSYMATLTNGQSRNAADVNDAKSVSGRLVVAPAASLRLGVYAGSHDYLDPDTADQRATAFGADLEWGAFRDGLHLMAGAHTGDNWLLGPDAEFTGAQGLASFYVPFGEGGRFAGVEPLLRLSWATTEDGEDAEGEAILLTPGVSLYVSGKNFIALNLDRYDPDFAPSEWSLKVQAFAFF